MPKLHGVNASPFVRKVRVFLAEKGIDYELEPVMPVDVSDEFRKLSPLGKVPCYEDGAYVLPDSSCICAYLDRRYLEPPLYPEDAESYGRALWYEEYADTRLTESLLPAFFQRVVQGKLMKLPPDEQAIRQAIEELLPPVFDYLEAEVGEGEGIVAGRFSIADISVACPFVNFDHAGERVDAARWPRLASYVARVHARDSFAALIEEEKAALASL